MGGHDHDKHGAKEDAERHRHSRHKSSRHRESSRRSDYDSSESRSKRDSVEASKSPDRSRDTSVIIGSEAKQSHAADATGSTHAPARHGEDAQRIQDGDHNNGTNDERFQQIYNMMDNIAAKLDHLDQSRPTHEISDTENEPPEEGEASDGESDALDHLSMIFDRSGRPTTQVNDTGVDMMKALADFAGGFSSKEEKGPALHEGYATVLNDSLRGRPNEAQLRPVLEAVKLPENVPNLVVPITNPDIVKAMPANGKLLDNHLYKTNQLIAKAIVPIATFVADIGENKVKDCSGYFQSINSAVRMLTAAFCYQNQTRKEVARMNIQENALPSLCKWDSPVGEKELFPFDVTKRCDEIGKVRTLGSRPTSTLGRPRFPKKQPHQEFKWPARRYENKPSSAPYSSYSSSYNGKGKSKTGGKPFLGKKSHDRHKKRH